jgi:hypothetical protein
MAPKNLLTFIPTGHFLANWSRLGLVEGDMIDLERRIMAAPSSAPVISGTGGLRKLRFAASRSGRGKSGAFRTCYFYFAADGVVFLVDIYGKNEKADLTRAERNAFAALVPSLEAVAKRGNPKP